MQDLSSYLFVDAQYIREELRCLDLDDEFSPECLNHQLLFHDSQGRRIRRSRTFFYDAIDESASESQHQKQQVYLRRVEELPYTTVLTGFIRPGRRNRSQKGVDVRIAVDMLEMAERQMCDAMCLVAGDADFAPLADAVRRAGPYMIVAGFQKNLSMELKHSADLVKTLPYPEKGTYPPFD